VARQTYKPEKYEDGSSRPANPFGLNQLRPHVPLAVIPPPPRPKMRLPLVPSRPLEPSRRVKAKSLGNTVPWKNVVDHNKSQGA